MRFSPGVRLCGCIAYIVQTVSIFYSNFNQSILIHTVPLVTLVTSILEVYSDIIYKAVYTTIANHSL